MDNCNMNRGLIVISVAHLEILYKNTPLYHLHHHHPMPRFKLERYLSHSEIVRRSRKELRLDTVVLSTPSLTGHMEVSMTMWALQFRSIAAHDDGTVMFARGENEEIFVRRDWTYAGVAYHVCCWSAIGRPSLRVANPRQLRRAVRRLLVIQEARRFRHTAPHRLAFALALLPRLGAGWIGELAPELVKGCLKWV